jgi:hypothetical protein
MVPFFGKIIVKLQKLCMIFEKEKTLLSLSEFEKLTGARWISSLIFEDVTLLSSITKVGEKLYKKREMSREQLWLGQYYQKEILSKFEPEVAIRWVDSVLGWGVFALRDFKKMEFIAEYVGKVRKRKRTDRKNAYCFEYILAPGIRSVYTIDALEQGGVARYINHSSKPNLLSSLATYNNLSHVILYAKEPIAKGEQLCYDYGPDYWAKRRAPFLI